jgi:hypothetical protein
VYILYCMVNLRQSICWFSVAAKMLSALQEALTCLLTAEAGYGCTLDCSTKAFCSSILIMTAHDFCLRRF